jgi:uncharacterized protein (TIGR03086 family)
MNHIDNLDHSYERLGKLVASLDRSAMTAPTPCPDWDVRALLNHVLGAGRMFTLVNAGRKVGPDAGDLVSDDAIAAVATMRKDNVSSWNAPGGLDGDRTYPFGTFPAPAALLVNLTEVVVHAWDLARATDQDATIDPTMATTLWRFWSAVPLDEARASGAFGPVVATPEDAPAAQRLLGYLGRTASR